MNTKHIDQPEYAIEFRVFDKESKELYHVFGFDRSDVFADIDGYSEKIDRNDCEIDQWIGLLDKRGDKIFTNDIVEVCNTFGRPVGLFLVRYNNREGRYILDGVTRGANISRITQYQDIRIVGNSHENQLRLGNYSHGAGE